MAVLASMLVLIPKASDENVYAAVIPTGRTLSGTVFRDYNASGVRDFDGGGNPLEAGQVDISVAATCVTDSGPDNIVGTADDVDTAVNATAVSGPDGSYSLTGLPESWCRIEFSIPSTMPWLFPGAMGGSFVQFIDLTAGNVTGVDVGVNNPAEYSVPELQEVDLVSQVWYPNVDLSGNSLVGNYAAESTVYTFGYGETNVAGVASPAETTRVFWGDVGATWGEAWDRNSGNLYLASAYRTQVDAGTLGTLDSIYFAGSDPQIGLSPSTSIFSSSVDTGASSLPSDAYDPVTDLNLSLEVADLPGTVGWGDIDIDENGEYLYGTNLYDKSIYKFDLATAGYTSLVPPYPGCVGGVERPWALAIRDYKLYLGYICDASISQNIGNLSGHVMSYDLLLNTWTTDVVSDNSIFPGIQLDYMRGTRIGDDPSPVIGWDPWYSAVSAGALLDPFATAPNYDFAEPIISDLDFDSDGSLLISFIDRTSMRMQYTSSRGDLLRASPQVSGLTSGIQTFTLEVNGQVDRGIALGGGSLSGQVGNGEGPGGGEYYYDLVSSVASHQESLWGGLAVKSGSDFAGVVAVDPIANTYGHNGVRWVADDTGLYYGASPSNGIDLYPPTSLFAKGVGVGDLELLSLPAPIEIGNRVWFDIDMNGVQDPGEVPLAGITVELRDASGMLLATAVTDSEGRYLFSNDVSGATTSSFIYGVTDLVPLGSYEVWVDTTQTLLTSYQYAELYSHANTGSNDSIDSDGVLDGAIAKAPVILGDAGVNNHTYDFGFAPLADTYDLALRKLLVDPVSGVVSPGGTVTWSVEVFNQGNVDSGAFAVTDYVPSGWTITGDSLPTTSVGGTPVTVSRSGDVVSVADVLGGANGIAPGDSVLFELTMTVPFGVSGVVVNWAEISSDSGDDVDSTPDTTNGTTTESPSDNTILNENGDEDDHDPAQVTVVVGSIEVTKTIVNGGSLVLPSGWDVTLSSSNCSLVGYTGVLTQTIPAAGGTVVWSGLPITQTAGFAPCLYELVETPVSGWTPTWSPVGPYTVADGTVTSVSLTNTSVAVDVYDLALRKLLVDPASGVVSPGGTVTWSVEVFNQGNVDSGAFAVTDYVPSGWTITGDSLPTVSVAGTPITVSRSGDVVSVTDVAGGANGIAPGDSVLFELTMTVPFGVSGVVVNWAEISSDSGDDVDSTPDTTNGTTTESPSDNTILNENGDEDDHDPAQVTVVVGSIEVTKTIVNGGSLVLPSGWDVTLSSSNCSLVGYTGVLTQTIPAAGGTVVWSGLPITQTAGFAPCLYELVETPVSGWTPTWSPVGPYTVADGTVTSVSLTNTSVAVDVYDLALRKLLVDPASGVVSPGGTVTWSVEVFNQGNVDSGAFAVTDYVPSGWTITGDSLPTVSVAGTPITVSRSGDVVSVTDVAGGANGIAPGDSVLFELTMTVPFGVSGVVVNWAEISSDSGDDVDSTPDTTNGTTTESPSDNTILNENGDEDDHDPAQVTVVVGSIEVTKTIVNGGSLVLPSGWDVTLSSSNCSLVGYTGVLTQTIPAAGGTVVWSGLPITQTAGFAPCLYELVETPVSGWTPTWSPVGPYTVADGTVTSVSLTNTSVAVDVYDLGLRKLLVDPVSGVVSPGATVTWSVEVFNQGNVDSGAFAVTDYVPSGWTITGDSLPTVSVAGTPITVSRSGDVVSVTDVAGGADGIAAGDSVLFELTMTVPFGVSGVVVNWAEISSDSGVDVDSTPDTTNGTTTESPSDNTILNENGDEDDHDPASVTVVVYDLALVKTGVYDPSSNNVTWTVSVVNQGTVDSGAVTVADVLPAGIGFVSTSGGGTYSSGTVTWMILAPGIAPGAVQTFTLVGHVDDPSAGPFLNNAQITSDSGDDEDSDPTDPNLEVIDRLLNTDTSIDEEAGDEDDHDIHVFDVTYDLGLRKLLVDPVSGVVSPGATVTWSVEVFNQGNVDSGAFAVTDYVPSGWTITGDSLPTVSVAGTPITVSRSGDVVSVTDVAGGADGIAPGDSVLFELTMTVPFGVSGVVVNWAEISSDNGDDVDSTPDTTNGTTTESPSDNTILNENGDEDDHDPASVTVVVYDLALVKTGVYDPSSNNVTWTVSVVNQGTVDSGAVTVADVLPAGIGFVSTSGGGTYSSGTVTWMILAPGIAPGAVQTFTLVGHVDDPSAGPFLNNAQITSDSGDDGDSDPTDPNLEVIDRLLNTDTSIDEEAGDEDDHDIHVFDVTYDLGLRKLLVDPVSGVVSPGATVTWSVEVFNQGNVDSGAFAVTDYVPSGWTITGDSLPTTSVAGTPITVSRSGDVVSVAGGANGIAPGDSVVFELTMTVPSGVTGVVTNWAEISSDSGDDVDSTPDTTNGTTTESPSDNTILNENGDEDDHDPASVTVVVYDLALVKTGVYDPSSNNVTWTVSVVNQGTVDSGAVTVADVLPAGIGFVSTSGGGTYSSGTVTWMILAPGIAPGAVQTFTLVGHVDDPSAGPFLNNAQITSDSGDDEDSDPTDPNLEVIDRLLNTDTSIDEEAGDEDDHDIHVFDIEIPDVLKPGIDLVKDVCIYTSEELCLLENETVWTQSQAVPVGSMVYWRITVRNTGDYDLVNIEVHDQIAGGCVGLIRSLLVGETARWVCSLGNVIDDTVNTASVVGYPVIDGVVDTGQSLSDSDDASVSVLLDSSVNDAMLRNAGSSLPVTGSNILLTLIFGVVLFLVGCILKKRKHERR